MGVSTARRSPRAAAVRAAEPPFEHLLHAWRELDIPEGWRAEIREEGIVMVPPPSGAHGLVATDLQYALAALAGDDAVVLQNVGVSVPAVAALYVPDLLVAGRDAIPLGPEPAAAGDLMLAAEITSPRTAAIDRGAKRCGYAAGEVPVYLLVDPWDGSGPTVTVFSDPQGGDYAESHRAPFGKPAPLPAPFDGHVRTDGLPVPPGAPRPD